MAPLVPQSGDLKALFLKVSRSNMPRFEELCLKCVCARVCCPRLPAALACSPAHLPTHAVASLTTVGRRLLQEMADAVATDPQKKLPADGTVHELTSNTLKLLGTAYDYGAVVGNILRGGERRGDGSAFAAPPMDALGETLSTWITAGGLVGHGGA